MIYVRRFLMAKDLPYFKFFVSEWNDGDITLEDYEVQGLFINLCSYYWSNECDLLFSKAEKKYRNAPEDLWQTLLDNNLIKEVDKYLVISFLDEQQDERRKTSKRNSENGKKSAEIRRLNRLKERETNGNLTTVKKSFNENSTIKRREEKRREEKNYTKEDFLKDWNKYKTKHKKQKSSISVMSGDLKEDFYKALKDGYKKEDLQKAMVGLFIQTIFPSGGDYTTDPKHLLKDGGVYLAKYIDAFDNNKRDVWGIEQLKKQG